MARKKPPPEPLQPVADRRLLQMLLVLAGLAVYWVLFYASKLPSLGNWGEDLISRGELLFVVLFRFDDFAAVWLGGPGESSLWDRVPVLAVAGAILGCATVVGWLVMRLCRANRGLTRLETFLFSTAVGLNVVSTYVLLVGLVGLVRNVFVFAVPAVLTLGAAGSIWLRRCGFMRRDKKKRQPGKQRSSPAKAGATGGRSDWLSIGRRIASALRVFRPPHPDPVPPGAREVVPRPILSPHWLWLAAPFVVVILLGGMLPPIEFDVREYHLQVPKEFFQQGHVGFLPHNVYGNMPMGTEMLSLLAMVVAGDWWWGALAGKTLIAAFAPLTALGLYAAGRRFFSTGVGVAAAVVYLSIPWIAQVSCLGLVEGASACYLFFAVYAVLLWQKGVRPRKGGRYLFPPDEADRDEFLPGKRYLPPFLLLAGYLAGAAASCKYPAVLFVVAPLALWILLSKTGDRHLFSEDEQSSSGEGKKRCLSPFFACGVFLLGAAVGCGAWFGKNWAFTGNPTYPLLYGVFGDTTDTWTPEKNEQWNRVHRPHDFSVQVFAKDMARVGLTSEWLSPLIMPLAALAFLVSTRRRLVLALAAYFVYVILMWWLLTHRIDRFWIAALPLVSLLAGVGACWRRDVIWRRVVVGLLVFGALAGFLTVTSVAGGDVRYFVRLDRLRDDPMRLDPWHRYLNTHARDGSVLVVGDAEVFDLEVPIVYSTCFDDSMFERLAKGRTAEQVRSGLAREGISHVYVHWGEIARYRSPGNYGFTDFVQPAVFDRLVAEGVLEPLPRIDDHPGRGYRVVPEGR